MSMTFMVEINDGQEVDLREKAEASKLSPARLISQSIQDRLFSTPVEVKEVE